MSLLAGYGVTEFLCMDPFFSGKNDNLEGTYNLKGRRGSRILKWGVNFCNNVLEPINILRDKKKKRQKGAQKKGGENSPVSPPLDPRLKGTIKPSFYHKLRQEKFAQTVCRYFLCQ